MVLLLKSVLLFGSVGDKLFKYKVHEIKCIA